MRKEIDRLIRDFEGLYSGDNWVAVGIADILNTIDFSTAIKKNMANRNTIFEIVEHSMAWRDFLIKRLSGDNDFNLLANDQLDWKKHEAITDTQWIRVVDEFHHGQNQIIRLLQQHNDKLLDSIVAKRTYDFRHLIKGVINHDYYHFGQIVILR